MLQSIKIWPFTIDDAFITYRYARNLADGLGPTYNALAPRAEGYTSFLWMVLMTIPHLINLGPVVYSKLIGLSATILTCAGIYLFVQKISPRGGISAKFAAFLSVLFYALLPETAVHAVSGMGTALYTFMMFSLVYLLYLAQSGNPRVVRWLPLIGLLCGLLRPEANLLVLGLFTLQWFKSNNRRQWACYVLLGYILPGAVYFLWRWGYYGLAMPLPFYVKTAAAGHSGSAYVTSFALFVLSNFLLFLGLSVFGSRRALLLILAVIVPDLLYFLSVNPIMGFDYRFLFPMLALILVLVGSGLTQLFQAVEQRFKHHHTALLSMTWISLLLIIPFLQVNLPRADAVFAHKLDYARGFARNHITLGKQLNQIRHSADHPKLVVTDAGAIPYFSRWHTLDALGLNDASVARQRVNVQAYIFQQDPDVLVLTSNDLQTYRSDSDLYNSLYLAAMQNGMKVISRTPFYQGDAIWVLADPDSPVYAQLISVVES